jgi:hypothetical protein
VSSHYPIFRIWQANLPESADASATISLDAGPSRVLIIRRADHVELRELDAGSFVLLSAFVSGDTFAAAADAALTTDPGVDLGATLARLVNLQTLVDFSIRRPARAGTESTEPISLRSR